MRSEVAANAILDETYRVLRCIGRGGMGTVWLAEHLRLPKQVAIKVLAGAIAGNAEAVARFRREAEIASRLAHPHIVDVLDFNALPDGTPYLVMELLRGESMRERLLRGALPLGEVIVLVQQIASALAAAHDHGVVHRDLKPENIFLTLEPSGEGQRTRAKVLDFGISKIRDSRSVVTVEGAMLGTPQYMAPEQLSGQSERIGPLADQFALAAIVLELLTGKATFSGETLAQVVYQVAYASPHALTATLSGTVPAPLTSALQRALAKDPAQRFPSIADFASALSSAALAAASAATDASAGSTPTAIGLLAAPSLPAHPVELATAPTLATAPPAPAAFASEGQRPAPKESASPGARPRSRRGLLLGVLVAVAAGAALGLLLWLRPAGPPARTAKGSAPALAPSRSRTPPGTRPTPTAAAARADGGIGSSRADGSAEAPSDAGATRRATPAPALATPARTRTRATHPAGGEATLPGDVAAELGQAQAALERDDPQQALMLARRSLLTRRTDQAFVLMTRAYCVQRNLGLALAMLRNVAPRRRPAVRAACRHAGLPLPP
ncbi:MAG: serine/threonine protein kinase [Proteobacteria bacterium]|nr:serine/threonine protein kinase [Pseudomonadota bacterium]